MVSAEYLPEALRVGGSLELLSNSPINVEYDVIAETGDIEMTSADSSDNDNITVFAEVTLDAQNGSVLLQAGDNLIIEETAVVRAAGTVEFRVDHTEDPAVADPGTGGILLMHGRVTGTSVTVFGNGDGDVFSLTNIIVPTQVFARGGDDTLLVGSNATAATNTDGHLHDIAALLDIDGGDGIDALFVDITGETEDVEGIVDTDSINGFGMADTGEIDYRAIEYLNLDFGDINGVFNIVGTAAETVLSGGDGNNVFNITSDPTDFDNGNLDNISGDIIIQAGTGSNTLNISDHGSTDADTGVVITRDTITGMAPAQITYQTTGWFAGGINIWTGQGSDDITIGSTRTDSFTTLWLGDGDDQVTVADDSTGDDGMLVIAGEDGNDTIANSDPAAWMSDMIVFGDYGEVLYGDVVVAEYSMGTVYEKSLANMIGISSDLDQPGGDDVIATGSGRDVVIGGTGADTLSGNGGNDILIGDGAKVSLAADGSLAAETTDFFTGGNDRLDGGSGNDLIMGGAGSDILYGDMKEDILIGDNARVRLDADGNVLSIIRLGQGSLDLIAKTQFDLLSTAAPETKPVPAMTEIKETGGKVVDVNGSHLVSGGIRLDQMRHGGAAKPEYAEAGAGQTPEKEAPTKPQTFGEAFKEARKAGKRAGDTFIWNGGVYDAGLPGETPEEAPKDMVPEPAETKTAPSAKTNASPKIMTAVAGSLGWQMAKSRKRDNETKIDPKAFQFLEKKMHRRRFREWTGGGFQR